MATNKNFNERNADKNSSVKQPASKPAERTERTQQPSHTEGDNRSSRSTTERYSRDEEMEE
ncbi:hypothetical protein [Bdellovibrio bacteriovorus]|uniref:hypothetical protein n=1 Tax=Bdellovibrio bacteriovorus TaxID=959 RepID=UPI0002E84D32|nr:hypothetical protein [Bdellovibrio bacteriovorus]